MATEIPYIRALRGPARGRLSERAETCGLVRRVPHTVGLHLLLA